MVQGRWQTEATSLVRYKKWNHRVVWVERNLKAHPVPMPAVSRDISHQLRLHRASSIALSTSRDRAYTSLHSSVRVSPPSS